MFVSSVKCPLIIVNLNKVMIRNPQQSLGCWIKEKQVTSNITQLSLAESLEKRLGRQMLASFSVIRSSYPRNERASFAMNWCYFVSLFVFGSPEISPL